jgi:UDP-3-O-[3-hydroxymyristoyl] glucosamine N-acyltransferase
VKKTLKELSLITDSELIGDPAHLITGVEDLESASSTEASFLANPRYRSLLATTSAGVICIDPATPRIDGKNYLISSSPTATFQKLIELFGKDRLPSSGFTGIHPTAVIHPSATLAPDVTVGPYCVIDAGSTLGSKTILEPHVVIGAGVTIGKSCHLHPQCTVREGCQLGDRVVLQPGAVIGSCGFGYATDAQGKHQKQEQMGIVVLEDDVEIGANTTIDRARFKETRICRGTKVDNLVQIAHNVHLGAHNLIVSQTGISGSVKTGKYVVMGGQTGTVGHIEIADGAMFAARSGIKKSIKTGGKYGGNPAIPLAEHQRDQVYLKNIRELASKLRELEAKLQSKDS